MDAGDTDPEAAGLPPVPRDGIFVARLEVDPLRLGDVTRTVELGPVYVCGSEVRGPKSSGAFEEDLYLEYGALEDLVAALGRLGDVARRVSALRAWCPSCARWHGVADDGRRMRAPEGAPCRTRRPPDAKA